MRRFVAEVEIDAPIEKVWEVLVDLPRYREWNPFTIEVRSALEVGAKVEMRVRMSKLGITISQRETLRAIEPPHRLVWGEDMIGVRAERVQTLEAIARGTRYRTVDTLEGPLVPIVALIFGSSLEDGFRGVAQGLADRVARR
jgi:uncharacterized protein YndB with AHSA1/START domain